jgi:pyrophosphate--fructose-6-phosphate 1-phosphotransferase
MAAVTDFDKGGTVLALPITGLIACELRKGKEEMVIEKSLVELDSPAFKLFAAHREKWAQGDLFSSPGPIQHWGPASRQIPISVALNQGYTDYRTFNLGEERKIRLE